MIFAYFVEPRKKPFFIYFGRVARRLFLHGSMKPSKTYRSDIIILVVATYFIWSCKTREVLPEIERFPSFLSSTVAFES